MPADDCHLRQFNSGWDTPPFQTSVANEFTSMAFLLPNLEQGVISQKWDPTKSSWEQETYLKVTRLPIFICPSDSVEHTNAHADCNYVPNVGWPRTTSGPDGTLPVPTPTSLTPMNGMTSIHHKQHGGDVRFSDVTDGLSNTICYSE